MYEPGSPSSPLTTISFSSPSASLANDHFFPGGEAGAAAAAQVGLRDLLEQLVGRELGQRPAQSGERPRSQQDRLVEHGPPLGLWRLLGGAGGHALQRARPGVHHGAVAVGGRGVAEAQAYRGAIGDRAVLGSLAELDSQPLAKLGGVIARVRGPAGGAGAHGHVALAARLDQVVVEGGDAVHRGLRQARDLGRVAARVVGDLAVALHGLLQRGECRGLAVTLAGAKHLDQVLRHLLLTRKVAVTRVSQTRLGQSEAGYARPQRRACQ